MNEIRYSREPHAAHHMYSNTGHDLERWEVRADVRGRDVRSLGLPDDVTYHSGFRDADGRQWWTYVRIAPLTPKPDCAQCAALERARAESEPGTENE